MLFRSRDPETGKQAFILCSIVCRLLLGKVHLDYVLEVLEQEEPDRSCAIRVVLNMKDDRRAGPFQKLARFDRWFCCINFPRPLLELVVGRMQRSTAVNA